MAVFCPHILHKMNIYRNVEQIHFIQNMRYFKKMRVSILIPVIFTVAQTLVYFVLADPRMKEACPGETLGVVAAPWWSSRPCRSVRVTCSSTTRSSTRETPCQVRLHFYFVQHRSLFYSGGVSCRGGRSWYISCKGKLYDFAKPQVFGISLVSNRVRVFFLTSFDSLHKGSQEEPSQTKASPLLRLSSGLEPM